MSKKTVVTLLQLVVFVGLGIFLIYWKAGQMSADQKREMFAAIRSVDLRYAVPVLLVGGASHLFRALRWRLLLEPLDIKPGKANTFFAVMIGYLVNALLPRVGEVAKCTVLARYEGVPADKMVGTIVAERAFDLVCLLAIIFGGFLLQAGVISDYASDQFQRLGAKARPLLLAAVAGGVIFIALLLLFYQRFKRTRAGQAIKGIADGIRSILHLRHRTLFLLYTGLIWAAYLFLIVLGFWGLPPTAHLSPMPALVILGFGSIGMILTPGGFGAYPVIVAGILLLYGIGEPDALAFGWVSWAAQTGVVLLLGLLALILLPLYNRTKHHAQIRVDSAADL